MRDKQANTFIDTLCILDTLAYEPNGMTKGQIQKQYPGLTIGQVGRILGTLVASGFIRGENKPHAATGKIVYFVNEYAATVCSSIARNYVEKH